MNSVNAHYGDMETFYHFHFIDEETEAQFQDPPAPKLPSNPGRTHEAAKVTCGIRKVRFHSQVLASWQFNSSIDSFKWPDRLCFGSLQSLSLHEFQLSY